jgi:tetratricopeptide (TPR) repeat protein
VVWSAAITVVLTLAVLGGSVGWVLRDRAARQAEAELPVKTAVGEAERLLGERKVREALSAALRAEGLLAQAGGHPRLSPHVGQLVKDLRMLIMLEEIQLTAARVRDRSFDFGGSDQAYAGVFRDYGIDVEALGPASSATLIRASRIGADLAAALDSWAVARRLSQGRDKGNWRGLLAVARTADPGPERNRLRDLLERNGEGVLAELSRLERANALSPSSLRLVGWFVLAGEGALLKKGDVSQVVSFLRRAQQRQPDDFWVNHNLAFALHHVQPPQLDEAIGFYRVAVALCPASPGVRVNLGIALSGKGRLDEAVAEYKEALRLKKDYVDAHNNLGTVLSAQGRLEEAVAEYRQAIHLKGDYAEAHSNLGDVLRAQGKLKEAVAACRRAISLKPNLAEAYVNLGIALAKEKKPKEAISAFQKAIDLKPDAKAYYHLGNVLRDQGRPGPAIAAYQEAIELKYAYPEAHTHLSIVFRLQGNLPAAIAASEKAIKIKSDLPEAHLALGNALWAQGKRLESIAAFRKAIEFRPDDPKAHCMLGQYLREIGQFTEALTHLRRGHEAGSKQANWSYPSSKWVEQCEHLVQLDAKLLRVLKEDLQPADSGERLELGYLCQHPCKTLYAAAVRFYGEAFAEKPQLADDLEAQHRYLASRAAARAGCGQGKDADRLDDKGRARLRRQALDWVRADLAAYRQLLEKKPDKTGPAMRTRMQQWQRDEGFAGVREADALARLPEAERQEWQQLWAEVADTLARAEARTAPEKKPETK